VPTWILEIGVARETCHNVFKEVAMTADLKQKLEWLKELAQKYEIVIVTSGSGLGPEVPYVKLPLLAWQAAGSFEDLELTVLKLRGDK
jgi:hypothetical protein